MENKPKKKIKVWFTDFFDSSVRRVMERALTSRYELQYDEREPDYLLYSVFGYKHLGYDDKCIKILCSGENMVPDFNICDYAVSCSQLTYHNRHFWLPPAYYHDTEGALRDALPELDPSMSDRRFMLFLYSMQNHDTGAVLRGELCKKIMDEYKQVDCPGRVLHNMEAPELSNRHTADWKQSKIAFLSKYKFTIAYENGSSPGYITEKLTDAYLGNSVPIYWGSEGAVEPFPKESMICAHDYPDMDALVARIIEVDNNPEEYMRILAANPLRHGMSLDKSEQLADFFQYIIEHGSKNKHGFHAAYAEGGAFKVLHTAANGRTRWSTAILMRVLHLFYAIKGKCLVKKKEREAANAQRGALGAVLWRERRPE